jgi:hypothetical protein
MPRSGYEFSFAGLSPANEKNNFSAVFATLR